jgi:hypothetical protein
MSPSSRLTRQTGYRRFRSFAEFLQDNPPAAGILRRVHQLLDDYRAFGSQRRAEAAASAVEAVIDELGWQPPATPPSLHPAYVAARAQAQDEAPADYLSTCPFCGAEAVHLIAFKGSCRCPVTPDGWDVTAGPLDTAEEQFACTKCQRAIPSELIFIA